MPTRRPRTCSASTAIPHYFAIDSDGVLTVEMLGERANVEDKLKS